MCLMAVPVGEAVNMEDVAAGDGAWGREMT
jgi:hypothetical protein